MRYCIKLSYDGSSFFGWQIQPNAVSVQETLEKCLSTFLKKEISVTGAGRTDSQVNAVGYIAHFDFDGQLDTAQLAYKLNAMCPSGIVISSCWQVSEDFHARFGATKREYTYFLHRKKDPFMKAFSYHCPYPLDVEAMNRAAHCLLGTHDFACFQKLGSDNKTSVCTVFEAYWQFYTPSQLQIMGYDGDESYLYFRISADRFLRNMVRAVVGSLIDVGRGRRSVEEFAGLMNPEQDGKPQRSRAGESVPGHALFLSKVEY